MSDFVGRSAPRRRGCAVRVGRDGVARVEWRGGRSAPTVSVRDLAEAEPGVLLDLLDVAVAVEIGATLAAVAAALAPWTELARLAEAVPPSPAPPASAHDLVLSGGWFVARGPAGSHLDLSRFRPDALLAMGVLDGAPPRGGAGSPRLLDLLSAVEAALLAARPAARRGARDSVGAGCPPRPVA